MSDPNMEPKRLRAKLLLAALLPLLTMGACGLDEIKIPPLTGPAEQGTSIILQAVPNILNADGVSTSTVTITVRDQNGAPIPGRQILVWMTQGDGTLTAGNVTVGGGPMVSGAISMGTANNGQAQITYVAGTATVDVVINVQADSIYYNGSGEVPHTVIIRQQ